MSDAKTQVEEIDDDLDTEIEVDAEGTIVRKTEKVETQEKPDAKESSEEDDDEKPAGEETAEERTARQERNRERNRRRRAQRRENDERLFGLVEAQRQEIEALKRQQGAVNNRVAESEVARIDAAIAQTEAYINQAQQIIQTAPAAQDWNAYATAIRGETQGTARREQLIALRQQYIAGQNTAQQPSVNPSHQQYANAWFSRNRWYNPNPGVDEDSDIARAIDAAVRRDGFVPTTQAFWSEFDRRLNSRLPHRSGTQADGQQMRNQAQPMASAVGQQGSVRVANSSEGFKLSPDRVQFMKDTGVWDDPDKRKRVIQRYMAHDRENKGA